jgi:hypothetical protein
LESGAGGGRFLLEVRIRNEILLLRGDRTGTMRVQEFCDTGLFKSFGEFLGAMFDLVIHLVLEDGNEGVEQDGLLGGDRETQEGIGRVPGFGEEEAAELDAGIEGFGGFAIGDGVTDAQPGVLGVGKAGDGAQPAERPEVRAVRAEFALVQGPVARQAHHQFAVAIGRGVDRSDHGPLAHAGGDQGVERSLLRGGDDVDVDMNGVRGDFMELPGDGTDVAGDVLGDALEGL